MKCRHEIFPAHVVASLRRSCRARPIVTYLNGRRKAILSLSSLHQRRNLTADASPSNIQRLYHPLGQVHRPAEPGSSETTDWPLRLLTILPGSRDAPILCNLQNTTSARNKYDAVSYTWGVLSSQAPIDINGMSVPVRANLAHLLRRLRHATRPRTIWVDALCINQEDHSERSFQVGHMGAIYEQADRVIVWLGSGARRSAQGINLLRSLGQLECGDHAGIEALLSDNGMQTAWLAVMELFNREWWTRAWIVQEYTVARTAVFLCGDEEISDDTLVSAIENLTDYRYRASVASRHRHMITRVASTKIRHLRSMRRDYQDPTRRSQLRSLDILWKFRASQSLDPRDKVFSIMQLASRDKPPDPDYRKPTAQVFKEVAKATLSANGALDLLTHHNRSQESHLDLPSWCPDWSILRCMRFPLWPNGYSANGRFRRASPRFSEDLDSLTLRGVRVERIDYVRKFPAQDTVRPSQVLEQLRKFLQAVEEEVSSTEHRARQLEAFCMTIIASRLKPNGQQGITQVATSKEARRLWDMWTSEKIRTKAQDTAFERYFWAVRIALSERALVITDGGLIGLVDGTARRGDEIFVFSGGRVPFCIREASSSEPRLYTLVGECYLHGFMSGKAVRNVKNEQEMQEITLV